MKKILTAILVIAFSFIFIPQPVLAAHKGDLCECVNGKSGTVTIETNILSGCDCSSNGGPSAIGNILLLVVNIMTIGVGILGVLGITIVGIQYLTAGGNEEKTRKAKRRLFEIILGLAVYVAIYAILQWLLPGFNGLDGI